MKRRPASPTTMRSAIHVANALVRAGYLTHEEAAMAVLLIQERGIDAADNFVVEVVSRKKRIVR